MRRLRRSLVVLTPVVVLLVLLATSTNVLPVRQIVDQRAEIEATRAHLDALQRQNHALETRLGSLDTPVEIERLAREELGYVFPGETAYLVMRPESEAASEPSASAPPSSNPPDQPRDDHGGWMIGDVWDWLTGRDLASE